MFHRTYNELPRTNNAAERWHRGFQRHVTTCHLSFWKFIDIMKQEEALVRTGVLQNQGGHPPLPQRRRYADNHARILGIVDDYANRGRINYLWSIARSVDFWEHFQFFLLCTISMRFIKQIYTFISKKHCDKKNDMAWYGLRLFMDFTTWKLTW